MKFVRTIFIVLLILYIVPRVVHAEEKGHIYFYKEVENSEELEELKEEIYFESEFTMNEKARTLFDALVYNEEEEITFVPEGTDVIWVNFCDGRLIINLNKDAENCGGNYNQQLFVNQIVKTAYSLEEIRSIMLYIEGKESNLPEGVDFDSFKR